VDLILDHRGELVAVVVVAHERFVSPVYAEPNPGPHLAAQVERVTDEPVAADFGDVQAVEREATVLLRALRQAARGCERSERDQRRK
jgi:hypothetical protein